MNLKLLIVSALKVIALTLIMFLCFAVAAGVVSLPGNSEQTSAEPASSALILLLICFLNTLVLSYIILRSRWSGRRLMATIFFIFYGVMTVMAQIESAVFIMRLPAGMLPRLFLMGALIAAPFAAIAVLILGKCKAVLLNDALNPRLAMPVNEWAGKLAVLVIAYVVLYFTFGYFSAWQNPAVREYYGGTEARNFFAHMGGVLRDQSWLMPFQILRGLMWIGLALPVIRMLKAQRWETALAVGLLFAVIMNAQLLLPNPYMPEAVRMAHLLETATSNFIFGGMVGGLLYPSVQSVAAATLRA